MKKAFCWQILILLMLALSFGAAEPAAPGRNVILYTYYRQVGWGDRVQIGFVDDRGGVWLRQGFDGDLKWPYTVEEQLTFLQTDTRFTQAAALSHDALFDLNSLILSTEDQGQSSHPVACDAGTEKCFAVQKDPNREARCILLGMSGDDCFENTDPNAQALYRYLRRLLPQVSCYGGTTGPAGFQPVPVKAFCGLEAIDIQQSRVSACLSDCEAGPIPLSLSEEERLKILDLVLHGQVTGKASAVTVTGGTVSYAFYDGNDHLLGAIELYENLLARPDGMYTLSISSEP